MESQGYEEIRHEKELMAIILRSDFKSSNITFFSPPDFSQQLGFLPHVKGKIIAAHFHKRVHRDIMYTQEVLFIRKGKIRVNFYTTKKDYIDSRVVASGDIVFLCHGGHGFEVLEDTEMVEVKQGPYSGKDSDKVVFKGVEYDPGE